MGGVAVERGCGRHLKIAILHVNKLRFTSKNGLKVQQNSFFSHLELQNFLGGGPPPPLTREGISPPLVLSLLVLLALGEHQRCSMAVPLSKSQRRPWIVVWLFLTVPWVCLQFVIVILTIFGCHSCEQRWLWQV